MTVKQTIAMSQSQVGQAMIEYAIKHSLVTAGDFEIVGHFESATHYGLVTFHVVGTAAVKPAAPASPEVTP